MPLRVVVAGELRQGHRVRRFFRRLRRYGPAFALRWRAAQRSFGLLGVGTVLMLIVGAYAPVSFMSHFIVFVLACFVGFQVIWNVSHSLHTPLMAVTNAISGIVIIGAVYIDKASERKAE